MTVKELKEILNKFDENETVNLAGWFHPQTKKAVLCKLYEENVVKSDFGIILSCENIPEESIPYDIKKAYRDGWEATQKDSQAICPFTEKEKIESWESGKAEYLLSSEWENIQKFEQQ